MSQHKCVGFTLFAIGSNLFANLFARGSNRFANSFCGAANDGESLMKI
jgi:hypothetical protein